MAEKKRTLTHLKVVQSCADVDFQCGECPHRYKCLTEAETENKK